MQDVLATYRYYYGAGTEPNRLIEFTRKASKPQSISAIVKAGTLDNNVIISKITEIDVEMLSTSEKTKALMTGQSVNVPDKPLSELSLEQQNNILSNLEPRGSWRISITNGIGDNPTYEKVVHLSLFNPA
jgi:hypothetical protein